VRESADQLASSSPGGRSKYAQPPLVDHLIPRPVDRRGVDLTAGDKFRRSLDAVCRLYRKESSSWILAPRVSTRSFVTPSNTCRSVSGKTRHPWLERIELCGWDVVAAALPWLLLLAMVGMVVLGLLGVISRLSLVPFLAPGVHVLKNTRRMRYARTPKGTHQSLERIERCGWDVAAAALPWLLLLAMVGMVVLGLLGVISRLSLVPFLVPAIHVLKNRNEIRVSGKALVAPQPPGVPPASVP
jgi:hypothetical protein